VKRLPCVAYTTREGTQPCFFPIYLNPIFLPSRFRSGSIARKSHNRFGLCDFRAWYISGIVLRPELRGTRAVRILLSSGIRSWLSSANVEFPSELLALAYSEQGQSLLERLNFFKIQNARSMPDRVPLYGLQLPSKQQLVSSLKERGVEID